MRRLAGNAGERVRPRYDAPNMRVQAFAAVLAVLLAPCIASAQPVTQATPDQRTAYDAAFQETLRKPADPPTLIRFAEAAVRVGDLEGAISALERLLLIEGDQPRVRLELGLLYHRLGSYEVARSYLEGARTSARATQEVRARAEQGIAEVDRVHGTSRFSGDVLVGLRYSTNANSGPAGSIRALGGPFVPSPTISRRNDFNAVAAANLRHRYDLGRQDGGTLETDLGLYSARQFQVAEANVHLIDLAIGPRMNPFEGDLSIVSLKPFVTGRFISVHDYSTYWAWGAGVEAAAAFSDKLRGTMTVLGRRRDYVNNPDAPTNTNSSGTEAAGFADLRIVVLPSVLLTVGGNVTRYTAATSFESFWEYGMGAALAWRFTDPLGLNGRSWVLTLSSSVQFADYDQPNALIDPLVARRHTDFHVGLLLAVPLTADLSLLGQAAYNQRSASLNNYAYDAFSTLLGVSWRF